MDSVKNYTSEEKPAKIFARESKKSAQNHHCDNVSHEEIIHL
jgi:hypothetical protein